MLKVNVQFSVATTRYPEAERKALALRAAAGDRAAEAEALESMKPVAIAIVTAMVKSNARLQRHREDLQSEALLLTVEAIREYNGTSNLTTWVTKCVGGELRRRAYKEYTANVPGVTISHHAPADLERAIFKGCAPIDESDSIEIEAPTATDTWESRFAIGNMLKRLTHFEREVLQRRWGIKPGRRRNWRAHDKSPGLRESCSAIAADYGVSDEHIRQVEIAANRKLEVTDKPGSAELRATGNPQRDTPVQTGPRK